MQEVPCVVCGSREAAVVYTLRGDPYLRQLGLERTRVAKAMCHVCGLVYSKPQLDVGELNRLYDALRISDTPTTEHLWWKQRQAQEDFRWLAPYLPAKGNALDIGCSEGSFLMQFHQLGWTTCGIEPSAFAQFGQRVYGMDIRQTTFADVDFPPGTFDVVAALRVLEHVADPRDFLIRVRSLVKPTGWVYLEVPNAWRPRHHPAEFLGAQHLRLFTRSSLLSLLSQLGFSAREIDDTGPGLRALVQPKADEGAILATIERVRGPSAQARALRRVLLRYRATYFWKTTMKRQVRLGLDRLFGPRRASTLVAWSKRKWRRQSSEVGV